MGIIESAPDWILKYKKRIEKGAITVEGILEAENRIRTEPIKISTVTRAINAMNYPITGLRREIKAEVEGERKKEPVKVGGETGRIERWPSWLQTYCKGIEEKAITVEDILEAESRIRMEPIKMATVVRAINTAGYPLMDLWRGRKAKAEGEKLVEKREEGERIERGPGWLQKYRERIDKGTMTAEDILEAENKIRKEPIKLITVTRALNAAGYPLTGLRRGMEEKAKKVEKPQKAGMAEVYASSIGKISEATEKRFNRTKKSWEKDLDKSLPNDYFVNLLLALAKLVEHGKTLAPTK